MTEQQETLKSLKQTKIQVEKKIEQLKKQERREALREIKRLLRKHKVASSEIEKALYKPAENELI